jgi:hypothetical protein
LFSVEVLDMAEAPPQARYENIESSAASNPTPLPNIVQVNNSEELTAYIRNFVDLSTRVGIPRPEPKSRFVQAFDDISSSSGSSSSYSNDIGSGSSEGESPESAAAASKLENISKKLSEYISRQDVLQSIKRAVQLPQNRRADDSPQLNTSYNDKVIDNILTNERNPPSFLTNGKVSGEMSANEKVPSDVLTNDQLAGTSTLHETVASPQVVEVYINGELQEEEADKESDLTVSQLSSQYLGLHSKQNVLSIFLMNLCNKQANAYY